MPEPLSIAAGVTTLLSNSYKFSKDIYELIDTIKSAPKHIQNISDDLKALYTTLGTLDSLLRDEQIIRNSLMVDLSANLEDALKNCVRVFREVGMVVNEYVGADGMANNGVWMKMKWTFKEKEVRALRDHLATYKATCMMAINTATYVRTIETNKLAQRIQEDTSTSSQQTQNTLAFIIRRLEAIEAQRLHRDLPVREQNVAHHGGEESEYNFRMRRFMAETASILSSSPRESVVITESLERPISPSLDTSLEDSQDNNGDSDANGHDDAETVVEDVERYLSRENAASVELSNSANPPTTDGNDALPEPPATSKFGLPTNAPLKFSYKLPRLAAGSGLDENSISSFPQESSRQASAGISDPGNIKMLEAMGFGPTQAPTALKETSNNSEDDQEDFNKGSRVLQDARNSVQAHTVRERQQADLAPSRLTSEAQAFQSQVIEVSQDTSPKLQPILTHLNNQANKLYHEGYFLKLDDQILYGKEKSDRVWTECFAQLVGTILEIWDAAELDAAEDGEVLPTFINLIDASIIMHKVLLIEPLDQPLQNCLAFSSAGGNRYLLYFTSWHNVIQWTAAIRLAIFEYTMLQEAYTGALVNDKQQALGGISMAKERAKAKNEDWVQVRFGAGRPWRRCWCVITLPDEKGYRKYQKDPSLHNLLTPPIPRGDIKFYDTKNTKKAQPIAQIKDAYSAFAQYTTKTELINASSLVKLEGTITMYSNPPTRSIGYMHVMQEVQSEQGCDMMLRWLFPVWDAFALYGRPNRLRTDTVNLNSLMFALPRETRFGYLELLDVEDLIMTDGSQKWTEAGWRRNLKDAVAKRLSHTQPEAVKVEGP